MQMDDEVKKNKKKKNSCGKVTEQLQCSMSFELYQKDETLKIKDIPSIIWYFDVVGKQRVKSPTD